LYQTRLTVLCLLSPEPCAPRSSASMSQPVSESLAILSASVVPALEATSTVAAKVSASSSEYIAATHRLDAVLNDASQLRGQKRVAAAEILSKRRSMGADLVESFHAADSNGARSPTGLSISEVCDGVVQVLSRFIWNVDHSLPLIASPGTHCRQIRSNSAGCSAHRLLGQQA
jgi:hypothetical protein